jgi:hypothetical protein
MMMCAALIGTYLLAGVAGDGMHDALMTQEEVLLLSAL